MRTAIKADPFDRLASRVRQEHEYAKQAVAASQMSVDFWADKGDTSTLDTARRVLYGRTTALTALDKVMQAVANIEREEGRAKR
jgi:hypothetical protein